MATRPQPALTEAQFQAQIVNLAKLKGWRYYHPWLSVRSIKGFPDLTLVRGSRLIFAELKREGERPTPAQSEWLIALVAVPCVDVYLWYPSDWESIQAILTAPVE